MPGVRLVHETQINEVFVTLPEEMRSRLAAAGFPVRPRPEDPTLVRLVTAWTTRAEDVDAFLTAAAERAAA